MINSYIYPVSARIDKGTENPYLENFMHSLENHFLFLNKNKPSDIGIFDILNYIFRIKYAFFNWPENIPEKKLGILQTFFLLLLLQAFRLLDIKLIYILHNKISHSNRRYALKKWITKKLIKKSFMIITHASEGISFVKSFASSGKNVFYFPHPVYNGHVSENLPKKTDVLIWGIIAPYKGIDRFLRNLKDNGAGKNWKITIAGKASGKEYLELLTEHKTDNIEIINRYLSEEDLSRLISVSRVVLFPYHKGSILSSGAFARTIPYPVAIVGPDCGSFHDFTHLPNVFVFNNETEMIPLTGKALSLPLDFKSSYTEEILDSLSWERFSREFVNRLNLDGVTTKPSGEMN